MGLGAAFGAAAEAWDAREEEERQLKLKATINQTPDQMYTGSDVSIQPVTESNTTIGLDNTPFIKGDQLSRLKDNEGFEELIYKDSEGYDTIGYGHKLTDEDKASGKFLKGISQLDAESLLTKDYDSHVAGTKRVVPNIDKYPNYVQEVLYDMGYNMGATGLAAFKDTLAAIDRADYRGAHEGIMSSEYARQVPNRAGRNATALLRGGY